MSKVKIIKFNPGDRVSHGCRPGKVLSHSRQNNNMVIIEFDKTFEIESINCTELKSLPKEIDIDCLSDFDNTLKVMHETISRLLAEHGPEAELYTDAGYNNVSFKLRLK